MRASVTASILAGDMFVWQRVAGTRLFRYYSGHSGEDCRQTSGLAGPERVVVQDLALRPDPNFPLWVGYNRLPLDLHHFFR